MKCNSFFIVLLAFLLIMGCSLKQRADLIDYQKNLPVLTKAYFTRGSFDNTSVTETDLQNYIRFRMLEKKAKGNNLVLSDIIPILWADETCLYVIQYEDGFDVISADKRSPVPIAKSSHGFYEEQNNPDGFGGHLNMIAEEVWFLKHGFLIDPLPESEEYIKSSLDFWRMVNADSSFITEFKIDTKGHPIIDPDIPVGHWELVGVRTEEEVYDSIPHLTSTWWHQGNAYNYYCPIDKDTNDVLRKCPAGCVAIAAAQMLYYLHQKDGVPTTSPSSGSCTGFVYDSSYVQNFGDFVTSTWGQMNILSPYDTCAALLVGDIGKKLHMSYHWDGSGAYSEDLPDSVFSPYGWNCDYADYYSSSIITSSLNSGYPVVCGGHRLDRGDNKPGHEFLIDGYKRFRTKTISTYEWVPDNPDPAGSTYMFDLRDEISYGTPHILYYKMNWGYGLLSNDESWCSLSGIWTYYTRPPYIYNRDLIYNFTKKAQ
jgi:hypothetical protein